MTVTDRQQGEIEKDERRNIKTVHTGREEQKDKEGGRKGGREMGSGNKKVTETG